MFTNLGVGEIVVVLVVLFFLFGGKNLSDLARKLGESGKELKKAKRQFSEAMSDITDDEDLNDLKNDINEIIPKKQPGSGVPL